MGDGAFRESATAGAVSGFTTRDAVAALRPQYDIFAHLLRQAEVFLEEGEAHGALVCAQLAASHAFVNHCGIFTSGRLERVLAALGPTAVTPTRMAETPRPVAPPALLHVLSSARPTGGDTRYVWRWIDADATRTHSVVLTRQRGMAIPEALRDAVAQSGGEIHDLMARSADVFCQAGELRQIARGCEAVALHLFPDDVLPLMAFGRDERRPPVWFINHSDHTFWLGESISDRIVQLRDTSIALGERRRGVAAARTVSLPTPLPPVTRSRSRSEARRALGLPLDAVLLLTVATAFKFEPIDGCGFLDIVGPAIEQNPAAVLVAVGPDSTGAWEAARIRTGGRVLAQGRRTDTTVFYEAADIYVDSSPFSSITSLLEAGCYGLPLASYARYSGDAEVLGAAAPGLSGVLRTASSAGAFQDVLNRLIADAPYRHALGDRTREQVLAHHCGAAWLHHLEVLYQAGQRHSEDDQCLAQDLDEPQYTELDLLLHRIYGAAGHLGQSITRHAAGLPYRTRVRLLCSLLRFDRSFSMSMFLPTCLESRLSGRLGWVRTLPGLTRWLGHEA